VYVTKFRFPFCRSSHRLSCFVIDAETIVFDDAGGGNLLGGLVIGALHKGCYESRIIDAPWFSAGRGIHAMISATVVRMVFSAGSPSNVVLCRSNLFDACAHDLADLGFFVTRESIIGFLQEKIEENFLEHLVSLGLPSHIMTMMPTLDNKGRSYRHLNEFCASYVLAHPKSRLDEAKTHSVMFRQLQAADVERHFLSKIRGRKRRCIECGEHIVGGAYRCEGAGRIFYVHQGCAKWEE